MNILYVCIKGDLLLEWLTGCGMGCPIMAVSQQKAKKAVVVPFWKLMSQQSQSGARVPEDSQKTTGPAYTGTLKKWVQIPAKECLSISVDEPASKSEDKQAESKGILL